MKVKNKNVEQESTFFEAYFIKVGEIGLEVNSLSPVKDFNKNLYYLTFYRSLNF